MECLSVEERFRNIEYNLNVIRERMARSAEKSGRDVSEIELMAVTKTVEPIFINHAISCGITLIGENKVQEFLGKKDFLTLENCRAHLIGHLQTNKVRQIIPHVSMIQSVDSVKLAREISKRSLAEGIVSECLVEVNIAAEQSKTGLELSLLEETVCEIALLDGIKVKGLMTIPPICENDKTLYEFFSKMRQLFIDIKGKKIDNVDMDILSMGMSGDYEAAIECGSTLVRVGSAIFGPRLY